MITDPWFYIRETLRWLAFYAVTGLLVLAMAAWMGGAS